MIKEPVYHEKHDNIKSEIFRFVSVRPPGRKKSNALLTIPYREEKFAEIQKRLLPELCKIKSIKEPAEYAAQLAALLQVFRNSPDYISSTVKLDSRYSGFRDFYSWTTSVQTEKASTITSKLEACTGKTISDLVNDRNAHSQLWDNYFCYIIEGTSSMMLQSITEFLRVYAIAEELLKTEKQSINSLERASIVLPECVLSILFPVKAGSGAEKTSKKGEEPAASGSQSGEEVKLLLALREKIEQQSGTLAVLESSEPADNISDKKSAGIRNAVADAFLEIQAGIDDTTQAVLQKNGIDLSQVSAGEAVEVLDNLIFALYESALSHAKKISQYVAIGSSLIKVNDLWFDSAGLKNQQKLSAEEAVNLMYNDWWQKQDKNQLLDIQIGDFKRVEQEIKCYVPGEVAHIENILAGEKKQHETRGLTRTETTSSVETETTEETERDTQTTDRFEMEKETESVISTDTTITAGIDVSANYGVVKLNASAGFSMNISTENATRQATEYAKSVTDRARNKLVKRIKELRTTTIVKEFEDKNFHGIDNEKNTENVVGIYRWVDKIYKATLVNYGRRMMIKFNLVEPAAWYKFSQYSDPFAEVVIPKSPDEIAESSSELNKLNSFKDINTYNYALWAKEYGASVNTPPSRFIHVGKSIAEKLAEIEFEASKRNTPGVGVKMDDSLVIPMGYKVDKIYVRAHMASVYAPGAKADIHIGKSHFWYNNDYSISQYGTPDNSYLKIADITNTTSDELEYGSGESSVSIPVSVHAVNAHSFICNIVIRCKLTTKAFENWQKETYEAIISAYESKRAEAEYARSQLAAKIGIQIEGRNPLINKELIQTELKKGCIEAVRVYTKPWLQHYLKDIANPLKENNDTSPGNKFYGEPYLENPLLQVVNGKYISFMEECFEWEQMTYKFHPYFWGRHEKWTSLVNQKDNDPLFEKFLSAGSSTIVVPVRPGYEKLFAYYLHTGQLWLGEDVPLATELDEYIEEELGEFDPLAEPVVEACWDMKIPTNVVILQKQDGGLNETGLPCFDVKCE